MSYMVDIVPTIFQHNAEVMSIFEQAPLHVSVPGLKDCHVAADILEILPTWVCI